MKPAGLPVRSLEEELDLLLLLVREAVYRMGDVEDLLCEIRDGEPLAELAPRGGKLISRYLQMRDGLQAIDSPDLNSYRVELGEVFQYLAYLSHHALELYAVSWRSEALRDQQRQLGPIGEQGERLLRLESELADLAAG